jgi:predicted nucleotide-binding protein
MNAQKDLHFQRLRDNFEAIQNFRAASVRPDDSRFRSWRESTKQNLIELFGPNHSYVERFSKLHFFQAQFVNAIRFKSDKDSAQRDRDLLTRSLEQASDVLKEALEEYQIIAAQKNRTDTNMTDSKPNTKRVFVIHGRDYRLRKDFFSFLRALGLEPLEWSDAVKLTGVATPYIGQILDHAFNEAKAIIVLITPDDEVRLLQDLWSATEEETEKVFHLQARPNVLFEAGMAFGRDPKRTLLIEIGDVKKFSDVAGRHIVRFCDEPKHRKEVAERLKTVGCDVSTSGDDWLTVGNLSITRSAKTDLPKVNKKAEEPPVPGPSSQYIGKPLVHHRIGGPGVGHGEFRFGGGGDTNGGVFIDENYLYVTDWNNQRLQRFKLNVDGKWTYFDSLKDQTGLCSAIYVDKAGLIYLQGRQLLRKYDTDKKFIEDLRIDTSSFCRFTLDIDGNIFTQASSDRNVIKKYDPKGTEILSFGGFGGSDGKFNNTGYSVDIVSDSVGNIYMLDAGGKRAQKFDNNGNYLAKWDVDIAGYSLMSIDESDRIYILEKAYSILSKYDNNGKLIKQYVFGHGAFSGGASYIFVKGNMMAVSHEFKNNISLFSLGE